MHVRKRVWVNVIVALSLVTLALPLAIQGATPASAQTVPPAGITGVGTVSTPALAPTAVPIVFNTLGTPHTAVFTCQSATGCDDVVASVNVATFGAATTINSGNCSTGIVLVTGSTATCVGHLATGGTFTVTINPGGPYVYLITFTGVTNLGGGILALSNHALAGSHVAQAADCPTAPPGATGRNTVESGGTCYAEPTSVTCTDAFTATATSSPPDSLTCEKSVGGNVVTGTIQNGVGGVSCPTGYTAALTTTGNANGSTGYCTSAPITAATATSTTVPATATSTPAASNTPGPSPTATSTAAATSTALAIVCPPGTTPTTLGTLPACGFTLTQQKKYVEITALTPTTVPSPCGGLVIFSEALKTFLGPGCTVTFAATGIVNIKQVADCTAELKNIGPTVAGNPGPIAPAAEFGANAFYICVGNVLAVQLTSTGLTTTGIPNNLAGLPINITSSGLGINSGITFSSGGSIFCVAGPAPTTGTTNTAITLCPTNFGAASVSACLATNINTQPPVCSATVSFTFTLPAAGRVVPYVRWAGEKVVLTKCFGGAGLLAGSLIEFTLKGNNPGLSATLLPTEFSAPGTTTTASGAVPSADTVYAVSDSSGCASVILLADGEGVANVDAAVFSPLPVVGGTTAPIINEHAFEVFYLKFDHVALENISPTANTVKTATALPELGFLAGIESENLNLPGTTVFPTTISLPTAPGLGSQAGGNFPVPLCGIDLVRAMVHGYFEMPGDPSGRPAAAVTIPGAPAGAVGSYVLPAGRWILPEDWPVLATFAGFAAPGSPVSGAGNPASVYAWDLNTGFAFDQTEPAVLCTGSAPPSLTSTGAISDFNTGPCWGGDFLGIASGTPGTPGYRYDTAPDGNCSGGLTVGIGPFDATQSCTTPFPLPYSPAGSGVVVTCGAIATFCNTPLGPNSTYLPNGFLSQWDAPMPPAQVTFGITGGPGFLDQVNKSAVYSFTATDPATTPATNYGVYYNPFYAEAIPASPLIPPVTNNGGYMWNSWGFNAGSLFLTAGGGAVTATTVTTIVLLPGTWCASHSTFHLVVANASGFVVGETVSISPAVTASGSITVTGITVDDVNTTTNTLTLLCAGFPAAVTSINAGAVVTAEQLSISVSAANVGALSVGEAVSVICNSTSITTTITMISGTTVFLANSAGIVAACGGNLATGTVIGTGPVRSSVLGAGGEILGPPSNPYPFWQWLPNPPSSAVGNMTATVYSDNHGEADVSLETGFTSQTVPAVNGICPATVGGVAWVFVASTNTCILPLTSLAGLGFQAVAAALAAGAGTCLATTSTGTFSPVPGATIGANGPTSGQICVNNLGNLEFGPGALLGTTTVQAIADYPYTRGEHPQISSGALGKVWTSAFAKTVFVGPAVAGPLGTATYTVTITARDVCGNPLTGEPINVFAFGNPGSVVLAGVGNGAVSNGTTAATVFVSPITGTATLSLEVLSQAVGNNGVIVKVVFPVEGIERFATVITPTTGVTTVTQIYAPGYQQVGGPSGSNFGTAEAVFSYDSTANAYTNVSASATALSSAPPACTGYWAYFAAPASATLPATSKPGDTASCALASGWNLVGNPFASAAAMPSGTVAYHWNGTAYDTVGQIPLGGAVWIFNSGAATTITLTAT